MNSIWKVAKRLNAWTLGGKGYSHIRIEDVLPGCSFDIDDVWTEISSHDTKEEAIETAKNTRAFGIRVTQCTVGEEIAIEEVWVAEYEYDEKFETWDMVNGDAILVKGIDQISPEFSGRYARYRWNGSRYEEIEE